VDVLVNGLARIGLAGLFAVAATHKLRAPRVFVATLRDYRVLPGWLVWPGAAGVIASELVLVPALLHPASAGAAGLAATALLGAYSWGIAVNLARGRRDIDCGCLGPAKRQPLSGWLLVRNAALLPCACMAAWPPSTRALVWVDGVSFVAGLLVACSLFIALGALGSVAGQPSGRSS
jgi:hypothetical protein